MLITYKALHDQAPKYIMDIIEPYIPERSLRTGSQNLLDERESKLKSGGDHAFAVCAPRIWNSLPQELRL